MMHLPAVLDNDSVYFRNNISELDSLIKFIEECDQDSSTHGYITPWTKLNNYTMYKTFERNDEGLSTRMLQKCLYIYNSFNSGLSFCKEHYSNFAMRNTGNLEELTIFKSLTSSDYNREQKFDVNYDENTISVYLMLNTELTSTPFCVDKQRNIYINPEPGSAIMIKNIVEHAEGMNTVGPLYYVKSKFVLKDQKTSITDLL